MAGRNGPGARARSGRTRDRRVAPTHARGAGTPQRLPTGIPGFDELTHGGLPRGKLTLLTGAPGTGKSVFALQTLANALRRRESTVFVCFEESPEEVEANLRSFNWDLPANLSSRVRFVDADLGPDVVSVGRFDIAGLLANVEAHCREVKADWVVFDGIDALMYILADPVLERRETYRLKRWIRGMRVGGLITAKNLSGSAAHDPHDVDGVLAFAADCVVHLNATVRERALTRTVRVVKHRGAENLGGEFPFVLDASGIKVGYLVPRPARRLASDHVSSGVLRLDALLGGGYVRGSGVLISGEPGTAKTTLAACFARAAAARGERVVFVTFDEDAVRARRNLRSVGLDLESPVREGSLVMVAFSATLLSPEAHFVQISNLLQTSGARHLVIDPITSLCKAADPELGTASVLERLLEHTRSEGITTLMTALLGSQSQATPATRVNVSTLADTWISLTYNVTRGERNRALSIIKSRGANHSNQVRELVLRSSGPDLADVYSHAGEVLMGTARLERERSEALQALEARRAHRVRGRRLLVEIAAVESKLQNLQTELESRRQELAELRSQEQARSSGSQDLRQLIARSRRADTESTRPARRRRTQ